MSQTVKWAACGCLNLPPPNRTCRPLLTVTKRSLSAKTQTFIVCWGVTWKYVWSGAEAQGPSSCAQGGTAVKVYLHMWVRLWLWARVERNICVSAQYMWVFVGEWHDFYRHWFTRGHPCPGLFKTCQVLGLGNGTQLQDHAKTPLGLTGVADAAKVRKIGVFYVDRKTWGLSISPKKVLGMHLFS